MFSTEPTAGRAKTKYTLNEKNELTKKDQVAELLNSSNSYNSSVCVSENDEVMAC